MYVILPIKNPSVSYQHDTRSSKAQTKIQECISIKISTFVFLTCAMSSSTSYCFSSWWNSIINLLRSTPTQCRWSFQLLQFLNYVLRDAIFSVNLLCCMGINLQFKSIHVTDVLFCSLRLIVIELIYFKYMDFKFILLFKEARLWTMYVVFHINYQHFKHLSMFIYVFFLLQYTRLTFDASV